MQRSREHQAKGKALKNHYTGRRHRRIRAAMGLGKLPSLAQMLAREGPRRVMIVVLQRVVRGHPGASERWWNSVLSRTLNPGVPSGGIDALRAEHLLGVSSRPVTAEQASLSSMMHSILQN